MKTTYYFRFDRRTVGIMVGAKRMLDNLTRYSIASSGISALATLLVGNKIDLVLPIVASLIGLITTNTRDLLSFVIDATVVTDKLTESQPVAPTTQMDQSSNPQLN